MAQALNLPVWDHELQIVLRDCAPSTAYRGDRYARSPGRPRPSPEFVATQLQAKSGVAPAVRPATREEKDPAVARTCNGLYPIFRQRRTLREWERPWAIEHLRLRAAYNRSPAIQLRPQLSRSDSRGAANCVARACRVSTTRTKQQRTSTTPYVTGSLMSSSYPDEVQHTSAGGGHTRADAAALPSAQSPRANHGAVGRRPWRGGMRSTTPRHRVDELALGQRPAKSLPRSKV